MEHISLKRGDDYAETLTIKRPDGSPYDLTGCTMWFTLKRDLADPDPGVIQHKTGVGAALTVEDAEGGFVAHRITAAETAALDIRREYHWDLQLKAADGTVSTVLVGTLVAEPDATPEHELMVAAVVRPARIEERQGRRWWACPGCGRVLAELVGDRAVVRRRDYEGECAVAGARQRCPRCGEESTPDGRVMMLP